MAWGVLYMFDSLLPDSPIYFFPEGDLMIETKSCIGKGDEQFFRQPWNTYSSIAFFVSAMMVFYVYIDDRKNKGSNINYWRESPAISLFLCLFLLILFLGSTVYHITLSLTHYAWDLTGVFLMSLFPLIYQIIRRLPKSILLPSMFATFGLSIFLAFHVGSGDSDYYLFAFLIINSILTMINYFTLVRAADLRYLLLFAVCGTLAFSSIYVDIHFCEHLGDVGGHAFWHVFAAASFVFLHLYLRSEIEITE